MEVDAVLSDLGRWPGKECDLAELALHLARDEYPDLDVDAQLAELASMAHEARSFARGSLEARVHGLCRYLFHEMGFHGNVQNYHDARNSYLNQVLERRTGIPLTLSLIVMHLGTRLDLSLHGIGLPGHFIVKATEVGQELLIDPFHGGRFLSARDCENLVMQVANVSFEATPRNLTPTPNARIVLRMLQNLKNTYMHLGDSVRAIRIIGRMRQIVPLDPTLRRDLGVCLIHAGETGKAIDHLDSYLHACPESQDRQRIARMLQQARRLMTRWN